MSMSDQPRSFTGAVATPHTLATDASVAAFRDGGSAIDAAIAAAAVLTVVYPHNVALGGDLIALVRTPEGAVSCVNASGWAAAATDAAAMRAAHGAALPDRGADTVTVPGGVRGWQTLREMGSRLSWARLLEPAREIADVGAPVARSLAAHLVDPENADLFGLADFDRVFRPDGRPLRGGESLRQPRLAETFAALADGGADEFYTGALAARTVQYLRSQGSVLAAADFAEFEPEVAEPISLDYHGLTVFTSPPNTHGFMALRTLNALARQGFSAPLGRGMGALVREFHLGNRLRTAHLADPRMVPVDVEALIQDEFTGQPAAEVVRSIPGGDTVGVAAADSDGYAISLIQSVFHAFGSGLVDPDTGVLFHDRGTSFSLDPNSPNVLAPRKRPLHTLMPMMTTERGAVRHVLATMGGQGQPQILTQVLLRMLDGANPEYAIAAPRVIVGAQMYGCTPDSVVVEADADPSAIAALGETGLSVVEVPAHSEGLGQANVVAVADDGQLTAAADPRADGSAVVVQYARMHA